MIAAVSPFSRVGGRDEYRNDAASERSWSSNFPASIVLPTVSSIVIVVCLLLLFDNDDPGKVAGIRYAWQYFVTQPCSSHQPSYGSSCRIEILRSTLCGRIRLLFKTKSTLLLYCWSCGGLGMLASVLTVRFPISAQQTHLAQKLARCNFHGQRAEAATVVHLSSDDVSVT